MIKVEVIESFTLERFDELKNIERIGQDTKNKLNVGDKFECSKELADYLLGDNKLKRPFVRVIEIIPVEAPTLNEKDVKKNKKTTKKKNTK